MAFNRTCIDVGLQLAQGQSDGSNSTTLKGHRMSVAIEQPGSPDLSKAAIYGLPLSVMNKCTVLPSQLNNVGRNYVSISAYEEGQTPALVSKGTIDGGQGSADVAQTLEQIVKASGYWFENNGVNCKLPSIRRCRVRQHGRHREPTSAGLWEVEHRQ